MMIEQFKVRPEVRSVLMRHFPKPGEENVVFIPKNSFPWEHLTNLSVEISGSSLNEIQQKAKQLNEGKYFASIFRFMLCTYVKAQVRMGQKIGDAILDFFELYSIEEEEYSFDTAYRQYHRWNKILKKNA